MKWVNHRIVTTAVVYGATGNIFFAGYALLGAVLPDQLEGKPPKENTKAYWRWRKNHRTKTHWPVPYLLFILVLLLLHHQGQLVGLWWEVAQLPLFIAVGALLHIAEDALCGRVPLIQRKKKIGLKLFTVGSAWEYFFTYTLVLIIVLRTWKEVF